MELTKNTCDDAAEVFHNPSLHFVLFLVLFLNLIAIVLNVLVIFGISGAKTIHIHLRILFFHLSLILLFRTCCTTYRSASMILNSFISRTPCDMVYTLVQCKTFSEISKSGLDIMMYCFIPISFERLLATMAYATYEKSQHRIICAFFGIILPWLPNILDFIVTCTKLPPNEFIPYCSSLTSSAHDFNHLTRIQLPFCFLCIFVSSLTIFLSLRKRKNSGNSLSGRYQLLENIRMTKLILPNVIAYSITLSIHILALVIVANKPYSSVAEFAVDKEWSSFIIPIFANFYPLAFLLGSTDIAKRCTPKFMSDRLSRRVTPLGTTKDYFKQYDERWR